MKSYKVSCEYTKAQFRGKMAYPANDNYTPYETTIRCYSDKAIFSLLLEELIQTTSFKYVKIINMRYELVG